MAHVFNDRPEPLEGTLDVRVFGRNAAMVASAEHRISVGAHDSCVVSVDGLLGGFRDLTYSYRFGPRVFDVAVVRLLDTDGAVVSEDHFLPGGQARSIEEDIGLVAHSCVVAGSTEVVVSTARFAQYVSVEIPGMIADRNWFHLAPGDRHVVRCTPTEGHSASTRGEVRALNVSNPTAMGSPQEQSS